MAAEPHPLQSMLDEARAMLADRDHMKSNSSAALTRFICRALETVIHGAPQTAVPRKIDHPEDNEPAPQPMPSRRL